MGIESSNEIDSQDLFRAQPSDDIPRNNLTEKLC